MLKFTKKNITTIIYTKCFMCKVLYDDYYDENTSDNISEMDPELETTSTESAPYVTIHLVHTLSYK